MDFVKNVALKCFKDEARRKSSTIMQGLNLHGYTDTHTMSLCFFFQGLAELRSTPNIEQVMFDTVEHR